MVSTGLGVVLSRRERTVDGYSIRYHWHARGRKGIILPETENATPASTDIITTTIGQFLQNFEKFEYPAIIKWPVRREFLITLNINNIPHELIRQANLISASGRESWLTNAAVKPDWVIHPAKLINRSGMQTWLAHLAGKAWLTNAAGKPEWLIR